MKKISLLAWMFCILLTACNGTETPAVPTSTFVPTSTSIPSPTVLPTETPTATPFVDVSKITGLATFNAIASVTSSENQTDIWVLGNDGFIAAYQSSRGHFSRVESPQRGGWSDVTFTTPNDGWIVGGDTILHWNGEKLEVSKPGAIEQRGPYTYTLYTVAFSNANDGWAAGCVNSEGGEQTLIYHWDGKTWSKVTLPDKLFFDRVCIHDIAALSPTDVWMVATGWNGTEYGEALHWDGNHWESFIEGDSFTNHSISALSSDDIWAINDHSIVWHWDGSKWSQQASLNSANIIYARKPGEIFAVGDKIWHWRENTWTNISVKGNFPADPDIVGIAEVPHGLSSDFWLLDSSGILYVFGLYWLDYRK